MVHLKTILIFLCLSLCHGYGQTTDAAQSLDAKVLIKSQSHPTDSRGDTVYEALGATQKDQLVVPGVFAEPTAISLPTPKYPKSLKKTRADLDVTVEGIISQKGDFIDATVVDAIAPDITKSVLDAVARYKFRPATLVGKPIALHTRVIIHFRIQ
jgi:outer membrane biosynthesis protein TonB